MLKFRIIQYKAKMDKRGFYLIPDNWDDWFEFEISYHLWIKDMDEQYVDRVKFAERYQSKRTASLPTQFETLGDDFVSIGFNEYYYEELKRTNFRGT